MFRSIKKLIGTVFTGVLLVAVAYGGWRWGDGVFPSLERMVGIERPDLATGDEGGPSPSQEVAAAAMERAERLRTSGGPGETSFDGNELTSLMLYQIEDRLPSAIVEPRIVLRDGRVELRGRMVVDEVANLPDLGPATEALPDTVDVSAAGTLVPFDGRGAAFLVERVRIQGFPLPRQTTPRLIAALDTDRPAGLPEQAVFVRLPSGLRSAYVEDDRLIVVAGEES